MRWHRQRIVFRRILKLFFIASNTLLWSYLFWNNHVTKGVFHRNLGTETYIAMRNKSREFTYVDTNKLFQKDKLTISIEKERTHSKTVIMNSDYFSQTAGNNTNIQGRKGKDKELLTDTAEADTGNNMDTFNLFEDNIDSSNDPDFDLNTFDYDKIPGDTKPTKNRQNNNRNKESNSFINWKKLVQAQTNLYDHAVVKTVRNIQTAYITAIASNSSESETPWDIIIINGWQRQKFENTSLFCCFRSGEHTAVGPVKRSTEWQTPKIRVVEAKQFICDNPWMGNPLITLKSVGLDTSRHCEDVQYVRVEHALRPGVSDAIAFCGKILYGDYPAERVIEWMEMNKVMGVHHVALFTYNVTKQAMDVLKYYQQEGYLTLKEFDFPLKSIFPRYIGQKYLLSWIDEQVTVFDCIQRFKGYRFVGILDVDEFLVPQNPAYKDYTAVLKRLLKLYPKAAGYTFQTNLFLLNWGETHSSSSLVIGKYRNRTKPMWDRRKSIFLNNRVDPHSVWTHGFAGVKPYSRVHVFSNIAAVFHYRNCRPRWMTNGTCLPSARRRPDNTMARFIPAVEKTVLELSKRLIT